MKKIVVVYGIISGLVMAATVWITAVAVERDAVNFEWLEVTGYASMIIALTMVFFGIKSYRDNVVNGVISFWKGVQVGFLISLISVILYWGGAMAYGLVSPGFEGKFITKYTEMTMKKLTEKGAPQEEIDRAKETIAMMERLFRNPLLFFLICLMEMLPIGIVITLISSALLRKKELLPAN
jgi:hypothetical protein